MVCTQTLAQPCPSSNLVRICRGVAYVYLGGVQSGDPSNGPLPMRQIVALLPVTFVSCASFVCLDGLRAGSEFLTIEFHFVIRFSL